MLKGQGHWVANEYGAGSWPGAYKTMQIKTSAHLHHVDTLVEARCRVVGQKFGLGRCL